MSRILLVDDNPGSVQPMAELLTQFGHDTLVAHDGPSALVAARKWRPGIVLLDIGLPGMDGFQVAAALRQDPDLRSCRIIAMSALYREGDDARLAAVGVDQLIRKPVDVSFLQSLFGSPLPPANYPESELFKN